jgi:heme/copper-type cytochrome/quinol oxidase subunit 3
LPFTWDRHAYGSAFYLLLGMHTTHCLTGAIENGVMFALFVSRSRVEQKHMSDAYTNGVYWYFVALSWLPIAAVLYLDPLWFSR